MRQQQRIVWSILACGLASIQSIEARGPGGGSGGGARPAGGGTRHAPTSNLAGNFGGASGNRSASAPTGFNSARSLAAGNQWQNFSQQTRPQFHGQGAQGGEFSRGSQPANSLPWANKQSGPQSPGQRFDQLENFADHRENIHDRHENKRDRKEDYRDRMENRRDHLEDIWDAQHDGGKWDKIEDKYDKQEDKIDHREDVADRHEDKRDHRENRRDYWEKYRDAQR
jgi:hypothetical protein